MTTRRPIDQERQISSARAPSRAIRRSGTCYGKAPACRPDAGHSDIEQLEAGAAPALPGARAAARRRRRSAAATSSAARCATCCWPRRARRRRRRRGGRRADRPLRSAARRVEHERFGTAKARRRATSTSTSPAARTETYAAPGGAARGAPGDASRRTWRGATSRSTRWRSRFRARRELIDPHGGADDLERGAAARPPRALVRRRPDAGDARRPLRGAVRLRARAARPSAAARGRPRRPSPPTAASRAGASSRAEPAGRAGLRAARRVGAAAAATRSGRADRRRVDGCSSSRPGRRSPRATGRSCWRRRAASSARRPRPGRAPIPARPSRGGRAGRAARRPRSWRSRGRSAAPGSTTTSTSGARSRSRSAASDLLAAGVPEGPAIGRGLRGGAAAQARRRDLRPRGGAGGRARGGRRASEAGGVLLLIVTMARERAASAGSRPSCPAPGPPSRPGSAASASGRSTASTSAILTDDDARPVAENRRRLAAALGLEPERIVIGRQVHGAELASHDAAPSSRAPFADAGQPDPRGRRPRRHATPGLAPLVFVADCLPVALVGPGGVAMLHCGWRGLAAGIVAARRRGGRRRRTPAIGPGIGPCCYEVGEEVLEAFADLGDGDRRRADARPARGRAPAAARGPGSSGSSRRALHELRGGALLLPPPRRRAHRSPGRARLARGRRADVPGLIHGLEPERDRRQPRAGARARPGRGSRSSRRPSTCRSRRWARWPRPG